MTERWKVVCEHHSRKWEAEIGCKKDPLNNKHYFWVLIPTKIEHFAIQAKDGKTPVEGILAEFEKFLKGKVASNTVFKNWKISFERIKEVKE